MNSESSKKHRAKRLSKTKRIAARGKHDFKKDYRRLGQLLVSILLFLAVFLGRNVYSETVGNWNDVIGKDVDFRAAFQIFSEAVTNDDTKVTTALKVLGASLLGREQAAEQTPEPSQEQTIKVTPLIKTGHLGLEQAADYGVMKGLPKVSELAAQPSVTLPPEPEQTPVVVTAMAQAYGDDGKKLPSNVSFQYYELGLDQTTLPVTGEVTSGFGYRKNPITGKNEFHLALDIAANEGTKISAFADGVVRYIGESEEFGLYFMLDHANNVSSFYAHCSKLLIKKGEHVTCGQTVALVGKTGNVTGAHLHLTILKDGIRLDPNHYVDL